MRVPPTTPPREVGTWESLVEFATEHKVEEELLELAKEGAKKALGREVAGSFTLGSALFSLISVAVFGPDRSEPFFDEAALGALQRVAEQITRQAVADNNLELFLAACDRSDHNLGNDDEFFRQGFWHGRVFLDFEPAKREAMAHNHPGDAIVFRFQTASPGLVDAIELDGG